MPNLEFSVKALIINQGRFLGVHKRTCKCARFELPGGRMRFGETAEETVIREVYEETSLAITPVRLIDTWNHIAKGGQYQVTGIIYLCDVTGDLDIRLSEEHDSYEWLSPSDLPKISRVYADKLPKWDWEAIAWAKR